MTMSAPSATSSATSRSALAAVRRVELVAAAVAGERGVAPPRGTGRRTRRRTWPRRRAARRRCGRRRPARPARQRSGRPSCRSARAARIRPRPGRAPSPDSAAGTRRCRPGPRASSTPQWPWSVNSSRQRSVCTTSASPTSATRDPGREVEDAVRVGRAGADGVLVLGHPEQHHAADPRRRRLARARPEASRASAARRRAWTRSASARSRPRARTSAGSSWAGCTRVSPHQAPHRRGGSESARTDDGTRRSFGLRVVGEGRDHRVARCAPRRSREPAAPRRARRMRCAGRCRRRRSSTGSGASCSAICRATLPEVTRIARMRPDCDIRRHLGGDRHADGAVRGDELGGEAELRQPGDQRGIGDVGLRDEHPAVDVAGRPLRTSGRAPSCRSWDEIDPVAGEGQRGSGGLADRSDPGRVRAPGRAGSTSTSTVVALVTTSQSNRPSCSS